MCVCVRSYLFSSSSLWGRLRPFRLQVDVIQIVFLRDPCFLLSSCRFLVLEHGVVLVYSSADAWADHHEPLDDISLSADCTVETVQEAGEVRLLRL